MSPAPDLQPAHPCPSCPFRPARSRVGCFSPAVLDDTVGYILRSNEHLHRCHNEAKHADQVGPKMILCAGFLAFLDRRGELDGFQNWRIGVRLGVLDPARIDKGVDLHTSWRDVLRDHALCSGVPVPTSRKKTRS